MTSCLTFEVAYGLSYISPALRLFTLMFRIFKKKPRRLGHSEVSDRHIPTASVSTGGAVPTAGDVPTESDVPASSSTPNTSSHPIGAEILVQGVDPITAE